MTDQLARVLPIARNDRDRRWRDAIAGALHQDLRHTPACFHRGKARTMGGPVTFDELSTRDCPWCSYVRSVAMGGAR